MHSNDPTLMNTEEMTDALRKQPKSVVNNIMTGVVLPESYEEARTTKAFGDIPIIVLTAGTPLDFGDPELNRQAAAYQQVWIHEMQAGLARLSARGRQIVLTNATHASIPSEAVISAIRDVLAQVRGEGTSR